MYTVYGDMLSGNCYKIKLLLRFLGLEHRWQHIDILAGQTHSAEFLALNPNARIPVLELSEGIHLWESNAILNYLADGTHFLPNDRFLRSKVLQWQFFEQYSHEPYIAVARYINKYLGMPAERQAEYEAKRPRGYRALKVMEETLAKNDFFVGEQATIADISLYAYTHIAHEGGFELGRFPAINAWFARIEAISGYVTMDRENG